MKELVKHGAKYLQIEDLGAWLPLFTNNKDDYKWIREASRCARRRRRQDRLALLLRQRLGQRHPERQLPEGYQTVLPYFWNTEGIDEFVLDYANRHMAASSS
jgi:hypothetical protein